MSFFPVLRKKVPIITSIHLWIMVTIILLLTLLYRAWPWRGWEAGGYWQYPTFFVNLAILEFRYHLVGSLFLIPVLYGTVFFWWEGTLAASILAIPGVLPLLPVWHGVPNLLANISILIVPMAVVTIISLELTRRAKERQIFLEREKERQLFVDRVIEAQEGERRRIAQELHDETIQTLAVIASRLENLSIENFDEKEIERTKDTVLHTINDVRRISRDLMPATLDQLGLGSALSWIINQANKESETRFALVLLGEERKLPPKVEINVFRIVQEALNNIKRHSGASEVEVSMKYTDRYLSINVKDNGVGFDIPETMGRVVTQNKLGLVGMRERVRLAGGTLNIQSSPGQGTLIRFQIPYQI